MRVKLLITVSILSLLTLGLMPSSASDAGGESATEETTSAEILEVDELRAKGESPVDPGSVDTEWWEDRLAEYVGRMDDGYELTRVTGPSEPLSGAVPEDIYSPPGDGSRARNELGDWFIMRFPWPEGRQYTTEERAAVNGFMYSRDFDSRGTDEANADISASPTAKLNDLIIFRELTGGEYPESVAELLSVVYPRDRVEGDGWQRIEKVVAPYFNPLSGEIVNLRAETVEVAGPGNMYLREIPREQAAELFGNSSRPASEPETEPGDTSGYWWYVRIYGEDGIIHTAVTHLPDPVLWRRS